MPGKNSEGSIYQRKDGRWCACLTWKGNKKYFYGKSSKEVKKKLKEFSNECGVDIKTVSALLGHSDIAITYNTYVHVIQKQKVQAIAALDAI